MPEVTPATDAEVDGVKATFAPWHPYHAIVMALIARIEADAEVVKAAKEVQRVLDYFSMQNGVRMLAGPERDRLAAALAQRDDRDTEVCINCKYYAVCKPYEFN